MLKNITVIEAKRGDNIHQYQLPPHCSIGEVFDVLTEFRAYALNIMIEEQKKSEAQINEMKEKENEKLGE